MATKPYPSEVQDRFIVRLPDGMRERIAVAAKANNRSMNAEIVARLEDTFSLEESSMSPDSQQILNVMRKMQAEITALRVTVGRRMPEIRRFSYAGQALSRDESREQPASPQAAPSQGSSPPVLRRTRKKPV